MNDVQNTITNVWNIVFRHKKININKHFDSDWYNIIITIHEIIWNNVTKNIDDNLKFFSNNDLQQYKNNL